MITINTIAVCGAGTMGSGIAQVCAQHGLNTIQFDVDENMLSKSEENIQKSVAFLVQKQKITDAEKIQILQRITFTNQIEHCKADLIIEAIIEQSEAKQKLFHQLNLINPNCIIVSNTSSISINQLAGSIANPERFAGMHFFNPAPVMKLVEIIEGFDTSSEVINTLINLAKKLGKTPVTCKDSPGFIVNRVARHYYLEAMKLIEAGITDIATIDAALENSGFKMGPFKLMDLIGIDINFSVSNIVWDALGKPERLRPSIIQQQKVEAGNLGKKTNKGFYNYS